MTTSARPRQSRFARLLSGGWSTGLFVIGALFDMVCVVNVPGAAVLVVEAADTTARITTIGVLLVLLVVACWATVYVRVRAPQVVLVAGGILMIVGVSYVLALVGVFHALLRWPRRTVLIASVTAGSMGLYLAREVFTEWGNALPWILGDGAAPDEQPAWNAAAAIIALLSMALVAGLVAYQRARVEASASRAQAEQAHERAEALDEQVTRQAERERIARDLHDGLGHRLSSVALAASAFEAQVSDAPVEPALADWARVVRQQAHAALEDVRGVVGGLRSDAGVDEPLTPASLRMVGQLLADLRAAGHRLDAYVLIDSLDHLSPAIDAAGFRIVQESMTNAIKHAPGAVISVTVDAGRERGIRIRVVNPLVAASSGVPGGSRGIEGVRERARAAGGTAWIGPYAGEFILDVSLPWRETG